MTKPLRVGVIGVGHLGSVHARIYGELPGVELPRVQASEAGILVTLGSAQRTPPARHLRLGWRIARETRRR